MKYLSSCILVLLSFQVIAQSDKKKNKPEEIYWEEGVIVPMDGPTLQGLIQYDHKAGMLLFKDGDNTLTFLPRNIESFSIHNASGSEIRNFVSLEYDDPNNQAKRVYFFEIIKEFRDFAILSKIDPISTEKRLSYSPFAPTNNPFFTTPVRYKEVMMQDETIYIFELDGRIQPYLEIKFVEKSNGTKKEVKVLEDELLIEKLGTYKESLKKYAKENKLSFSDKNDFLKIMEQYQRIIQ